MSAGWRLLAGLPAWEVSEIARLSPADGNGGDGNAAHERHRRMLSLAAHVAAAMRTLLDGGLVRPEEQQWLSPVCEWVLVADELRAVAGQERAWRDARRDDALIFGTGKPSAIEAALGSGRGAPDGRAQVEQVIAETFTREASVWVPDFLAPVAPASGTTARPERSEAAAG